jgi:N-acetylneuraminic acid mutarotase
MTVPRSELAAVAIGDEIYVVGGFGGGTVLDRFDTATQTWQRLADVPADVNHPGVAALDGKLHLAGGYLQTLEAFADHWAYDPATDRWEDLAPLPEARGALGLVALDGRLYAVGGATLRLGGPVTGAVDIYDPEADTWSSATTMPTPREHLAVAAGAGTIWTAGGRANGDDGRQIASTAEVYDPTGDVWETLPPLPTPRGGVAGIWVAERFVTVGGETIFSILDPLTHPDVEAYEPATDTWLALPPLPTPRHGLATAAVGKTLYTIGGGPLAGEALASPAVEALTF